MRTPEELKKSMCLCFRIHNCTGCAYNAMHCFGVIGEDALAYIEYLEERITKQNALLALMGITIPEDKSNEDA